MLIVPIFSARYMRIFSKSRRMRLRSILVTCSHGHLLPFFFSLFVLRVVSNPMPWFTTDEVRSRSYPTVEHTYPMNKVELEEFEKMVMKRLQIELKHQKQTEEEGEK